MPRSLFAATVDGIQKDLRPRLLGRGFTVRGRSFNRVTEDALTQVVSFQMGPSDPPGTTYIPGVRENMHGLFTINLGVYVPEVAQHCAGGAVKSWIQEYHCCVRARLGNVCEEGRDIWWPARRDDALVNDLWRRLDVAGLPFLDRYATRDRILAEWRDRADNLHADRPPRIVMAVILAERGERELAGRLLARQVLETRNPGHPAYVRQLARQLAVEGLDG